MRIPTKFLLSHIIHLFFKDIIIILISTSRFEIKRKNQPNDTISRYGDEINHTKNEICVKNGII